MADSFSDWIGDHAGLLNLARWVRHFIMVYRHYYVGSPELEQLSAAARTIIAQSNQAFSRQARRMADLCRGDRTDGGSADALRRETLALHTYYRDPLERVIEDLERLERRPVYAS
jgi:hypothetical protein